jgi:hypothetical protein
MESERDEKADRSAWEKSLGRLGGFLSVSQIGSEPLAAQHRPKGRLPVSRRPPEYTFSAWSSRYPWPQKIGGRYQANAASYDVAVELRPGECRGHCQQVHSINLTQVTGWSSPNRRCLIQTDALPTKIYKAPTPMVALARDQPNARPAFPRFMFISFSKFR